MTLEKVPLKDFTVQKKNTAAWKTFTHHAGKSPHTHLRVNGFVLYWEWWESKLKHLSNAQLCGSIISFSALAVRHRRLMFALNQQALCVGHTGTPRERLPDHIPTWRGRGAEK